MTARQSTEFSAVQAGLGASYRLDKNSRYVYVDFELGAPVVYTDGAGGTASVSDAGLNVLLADGEVFQVRVEQAFAGSAPQVLNGARGLKFVLDAADNDGVSIGLGQGAAGSETPNKGKFVVGTDEFFIRVKLDLADVSDTDQCAVGFFKGGWDAGGLFAGHDDFAALNIDNGDIKIVTDNDNAGPSTTDTTMNLGDYTTEADVVTLEVRVSLSGRVRFLVNGADPTVTVSGFALDSGDTVYAGVYLLTDTTGDPELTIRKWESGLISSRGLETIDDDGDA